MKENRSYIMEMNQQLNFTENNISGSHVVFRSGIIPWIIYTDNHSNNSS